jgi:hypothetical protein
MKRRRRSQSETFEKMFFVGWQEAQERAIRPG